VALLYPADRFRMTADGMAFTDADSNAPQEELTLIFTEALQKAGFAFPARHVGGNFTTFKPYEGGIFLIDAHGGLFHLLRRDGKPKVSKIALPAGLSPRHVLVSESKERLWLGVILDSQNRIWLIRQRDMALLGLHIPGYAPDRMDCKLIFDPLYLTVLTSDAVSMHAGVFTLPAAESPNGSLFEAFHCVSHIMSRARECWQSRLADTLFPFRLTLGSEDSALLHPVVVVSQHWVHNALPFCLVLAGLYALLLWRAAGAWRSRYWVQVAFVALTGLYGLIPLLLLREKG